MATAIGPPQGPQLLPNPHAKFGNGKGSSRGLLWRTKLVRAMESRQSSSSLGFYTLKKEVEQVVKQVETMSSAWLKQEKAILINLENRANESNIWDDLNKAHDTLLALTNTTENVTLLKELRSKAEDAKLIVELTEMEAVDSWFVDKAFNIVEDLKTSLHQYELSKLLSGPYDEDGAILTITAGDGSSDAQESANLLLRMYLQWAEKNNYKMRVVENSFGQEVVIKSATIEFEWRFAYGFLSGEKGMHQIVRQSASSGKNTTSTAGVDVLPLFLENSADLELPNDDLAISFSSGSGNRSLSKAEMAVHIVHIPTGISVYHSGERNQLANKIKALYHLKAKLLATATEQQAPGIKHIRHDVVKAKLEQPIRKYVFYPKMLVQDLRTGIKILDIMSIMSGDFDILIKDYLIFKHMKSTKS